MYAVMMAKYERYVIVIASRIRTFLRVSTSQCFVCSFESIRNHFVLPLILKSLFLDWCCCV